ncbi:solute carrier family 38 member 3 [Rhinolophus ferrumequinum]|uniref:Solute carrier family 38 member 3 n=1 Tax=Rhinolophus ferrumequinum TaxID=59479 RepID=A0A7J7UKR2_RHIFE|nr:solute carrier family 38 member 3 [Rhinolophus ferrumequinum]
MLFPNREFSWLRHTLIATGLLTCINLLVIFAPNILGIFGVIGATSAPCLIFIFPAIFYFRIVPTEKEPARSTPKILVRGAWRPVGWYGRGAALTPDLTLPSGSTGPVFCWAWPPADDHELELHHH